MLLVLLGALDTLVGNPTGRKTKSALTRSRIPCVAACASIEVKLIPNPNVVPVEPQHTQEHFDERPVSIEWLLRQNRAASVQFSAIGSPPIAELRTYGSFGTVNSLGSFVGGRDSGLSAFQYSPGPVTYAAQFPSYTQLTTTQPQHDASFELVSGAHQPQTEQRTGTKLNTPRAIKRTRGTPAQKPKQPSVDQDVSDAEEELEARLPFNDPAYSRAFTKARWQNTRFIGPDRGGAYQLQTTPLEDVATPIKTLHGGANSLHYSLAVFCRYATVNTCEAKHKQSTFKISGRINVPAFTMCAEHFRVLAPIPGYNHLSRHEYSKWTKYQKDYLGYLGPTDSGESPYGVTFDSETKRPHKVDSETKRPHTLHVLDTTAAVLVNINPFYRQTVMVATSLTNGPQTGSYCCSVPSPPDQNNTKTGTSTVSSLARVVVKPTGNGVSPVTVVGHVQVTPRVLTPSTLTAGEPRHGLSLGLWACSSPHAMLKQQSEGTRSRMDLLKVQQDDTVRWVWGLQHKSVIQNYKSITPVVDTNNYLVALPPTVPITYLAFLALLIGANALEVRLLQNARPTEVFTLKIPEAVSLPPVAPFENLQIQENWKGMFETLKQLRNVATFIKTKGPDVACVLVHNVHIVAPPTAQPGIPVAVPALAQYKVESGATSIIREASLDRFTNENIYVDRTRLAPVCTGVPIHGDLLQLKPLGVSMWVVLATGEPICAPDGKFAQPLVWVAKVSRVVRMATYKDKPFTAVLVSISDLCLPSEHLRCCKSPAAFLETFGGCGHLQGSFYIHGDKQIKVTTQPFLWETQHTSKLRGVTFEACIENATQAIQKYSECVDSAHFDGAAPDETEVNHLRTHACITLRTAATTANTIHDGGPVTKTQALVFVAALYRAFNSVDVASDYFVDAVFPEVFSDTRFPQWETDQGVPSTWRGPNASLWQDAPLERSAGASAGAGAGGGGGSSTAVPQSARSGFRSVAQNKAGTADGADVAYVIPLAGVHSVWGSETEAFTAACAFEAAPRQVIDVKAPFDCTTMGRKEERVFPDLFRAVKQSCMAAAATGVVSLGDREFALVDQTSAVPIGHGVGSLRLEVAESKPGAFAVLPVAGPSHFYTNWDGAWQAPLGNTDAEQRSNLFASTVVRAVKDMAAFPVVAAMDNAEKEAYKSYALKGRAAQRGARTENISHVGSLARFANGGCVAPPTMFVETQEGMAVYAARPLVKGEALEVDYRSNTAPWLINSYGCACVGCLTAAFRHV